MRNHVSNDKLGPLWVMLLLVGALVVIEADALQIRSRDKSIVGEYQRVFGPQSPDVEMNPAFVPGASLFSGMGWPAHPTEWYRNFTLISPVHFIGAAHYKPDPEWNIRFLGEDGKIRDYEIKSMEVVKNDLGQATDLFVGTLEEEVDLKQVSPVPVFNPIDESYVGKEMLVFGKVGEAMKRDADGEWMIESDPGFDTTRMLYFDYDPQGSNPKDIHFQGGDSGSPVFVMVGGKPSIVGVASSFDEVAGRIRSSSCLVPAYAEQIDSILEESGYHLVRAIAPPELSFEARSEADGPLTQGQTGAVTLKVENDGASELHNLRMVVGGATPPDQVTGTGWISTKLEDGSWTCRRAGLETARETSVSVMWNSVPSKVSLNCEIEADGVAQASFDSKPPVGGP